MNSYTKINFRNDTFGNKTKVIRVVRNKIFFAVNKENQQLFRMSFRIIFLTLRAKYNGVIHIKSHGLIIVACVVPLNA